MSDPRDDRLLEGRSLGERVRNRRKALGWTMGVLAVKAGLSKTFICEIEHDKTRPGAETVSSLARVFGTTMDALMARPSVNGRASHGDLVIPEGLRALAEREELPLGTVTLLIALRGVLAVHQRRTSREPFDWLKFYGAIKDFL